MSAKAESPLKKVQANNQQYKKNADKIIAEAKKLKAKDPSIRIEEYRTKLQELKTQSVALLAAVSELKVENETDKKPDPKFDQKKAAEEKLIKDCVTKIDAQISALPVPAATVKDEKAATGQSTAASTVKSPEKPAPAPKQADADEGEDEEEDEEPTEGQEFVALQDWEGEEEDDLPITKGEVLTFVDVEEEDDTVYLMRNQDGEEGYVFSDLLKRNPSAGSSKRVRIADGGKTAAKKEAEGDEPEEEEEDLDDETELSQADTTMMSEGQDVSEDEAMRSRKSGKVLWKKVAQMTRQTSTNDVLNALGALSFGYRASFLGPFAESYKYNLLSYLPASLSDSRLFFRDLFLDPQTLNLRPRNARMQRIVTMVQVRNLPIMIDGVETFSRHVRICLFDGKNVLSNIHTIRASITDKDPRTWNFTVKPNDPAVKILDSAEFYIRACQCNTDLGILLECNATCTRTGAGELFEISCGWIFLPLFDDQGQLVVNKQYELQLNGGTPFEKNITLDPFRKAEDVNPLKSLMMQQQVPMIVFKLAVPTKEQKDTLDLLPDVIIGNLRMAPMFSLYREILADAMLSDRDDLNSAEPYFSPFLANFPKLAEQPDIVDALRAVWNDYLTSARQKATKDAQKEMLQQLFMQVAYPLCYCDQLPAWRIGDKKSEDERAAIINKLLAAFKSTKSVLSILLSSEVSHAPMTMEELVYRVDAEYS